MRVDKPSTRDAEEILRVLAARTGTLDERWKPPTSDGWLVARDGEGIAAVFSGRIDYAAGAIYGDLLEALWADGAPTERGTRGLSAIISALHLVADADGLAVYSVVNAANERQLNASRKRGYVDVPVVVLKRPPRRR